MICEHCARWADRTAETGQQLTHAGCPGRTWCDCQHGQVRGSTAGLFGPGFYDADAQVPADPRACPLDGAQLRAVSSQLHGPTRYTHTDGTEHYDRTAELRDQVPVEELTEEETAEADARWATARRANA